MKSTEKRYLITRLIEAYAGGSLQSNSEYQRGPTWSLKQKRSFIDSILRSYPAPAVYLHRIDKKSLDGTPTTKWDIVDGQQRIRTLHEFHKGEFRLPRDDEISQLQMPPGVRGLTTPWSGCSFEHLPAEAKLSLTELKLTVFEITEVDHPDEIRDLFIRLQRGSTLTRQQVRDAWPGNIVPYIVHLAGKLNSQPSTRLFAQINKTGSQLDSDEKDRFVSDRQLCAQLLLIYLARQHGSATSPTISAPKLDQLYHEHTNLSHGSEDARLFESVIHTAESVIVKLQESHQATKKKIRRLEAFSLFMFLHDYRRSTGESLHPIQQNTLAERMNTPKMENPVAGKQSTRGQTIDEYYAWWRRHVARELCDRITPSTLMPESQKRQVREKLSGICQLCGKPTQPDTEEFRLITSFGDGGRVAADNLQLIHAECAYSKH